MFDKLFGGVKCHPSDLIGREEEEEVVQERKSFPLLISRCNINSNGSPQEPFSEWISTIDVLFNTITALKQFSPMKISFLAC